MRELTLKELYDGDFYHICTEGLEHKILFKDEEDYRIAWNYLALSAWREEVDVVAFVLMSNHIHTLIACQDRKQAERYIRRFKQLFSMYLRNQYGSQKTMHCSDDSISLIDSIQYLRNCIAYIFRNPVSAKICTRVEDYKWSSYDSSFRMEESDAPSYKINELSFNQKRKLLRTGINLASCPFLICEGYISLGSFVRSDLLGKAFWNSGKSFLYHLGCCNDAKMEYELVHQPLMNATDTDMYDAVVKYVSNRFHNKSISDLTTSEKCSILKSIFFNNRTTIPQLSRILGLQRDLVRRILSQ